MIADRPCFFSAEMDLLQKRELSKDLRSIVDTLFPASRPAGTFGFQSLLFPGQIELEDGPVTLSQLAKLEKAETSLPDGVQVFFAGFRSRKADAGEVEWVECTDLKSLTGSLKVEMFAKLRLFDESTPRFFAITNLLHISKEAQADFLQEIEQNLQKFSGKEPDAMKYVKNLWQRSAYLAQRDVHLEWHLKMLKMLKPLLDDWVAELSQIASHLETLRKMMMSGLHEQASADLPTLRHMAAFSCRVWFLLSVFFWLSGQQKPDSGIVACWWRFLRSELDSIAVAA